MELNNWEELAKEIEKYDMLDVFQILSNREHDIIELRLSGVTLAEVGRTLKISTEKIRLIENSVFIKMKSWIAKRRSE